MSNNKKEKNSNNGNDTKMNDNMGTNNRTNMTKIGIIL